MKRLEALEAKDAW